MISPRFTAGAEAAHAAPMTHGRGLPPFWPPVPAPRGLDEAEAAGLEAGLGGLPGAWHALRHVDEAGELSVVLVPVGGMGADASAPAYVVHREGALLRLDACRGDDYARLGAYGAAAPLLRALAAALAGATGRG